MPFKYLTNIPLDKAREEYIDALKKDGLAPKTETLPVLRAAGRITAAPVYAKINAPHYSACAMDGIALDSKLTFGASETTPVTLKAEQYTKIDTGDPLPPGADAVVMIEDVIKDGDTVKLFSAAAPRQHIRQIGEDICAGEMLLSSFSKVTPAAVGAAIASGVSEVEVIKRPVVGIIPTGDELVPPCPNPKEGEILEFNSAIFSAMINEWGAQSKVYSIVKDDPGKIRDALKKALSECDIVLLNAGSSAGGEDFAADAISGVGKVLFHGLAIKPGKPAILGYSGTKAILGVPGYPVSGIIVLQQILRPIVSLLCGIRQNDSEYSEAVLSKAIVSTLKYQEFVRVRLGYVNGKLIASPLSRGSGVVTSYMKADGIVQVPQDSEGYEGGASVKVQLLREKSEINSGIVAIGSHDPLLDELSELLKLEFGDISLNSSHVGSMGGIMAVRRGEAHIAGTHLLDEKSGEYNVLFIKKYFPNGGVRLVECVRRTQGLILQAGNPKNISSIADLKSDGVRYINRQKGSGTRILIDYLCHSGNIDTSKIHGYNIEEYTHTSVAAQILADNFDAGLGIYSAARMYGLEFLPICDEQYDFLIPDYAWDMPQIKSLLETLKSEKFRQKLESLGGYTLVSPGAVREV
jgi:putative molybdopterin biosynthesis protein